ncbi:MAG: thiamine pyrophosphate-dependent enzyme [Candidatus Accumulibacter sp.]|uniref:dehydrogenase E1 component subunit alpha/beta n=1 Tax=Accumulibacter sp. TaxID=2053492 RepID=UPI0025846383|nr:alpha-ketoacid dehydrogenase subunit alpha/beta [Accumulibacter sp.]MCM8621358.1 thiamine pyrophosphate-dependent enzyme [Accumulibacter sp.]
MNTTPHPFDRNPLGKPIIGTAPKELFAFGHLIRETEKLILALFGRGLVSGTTHTCLGQEICQMAVVRALNDPDDHVLSNHRNHGHFLAYSGDFLGLVAEIMGRASGVCGGFGGSQHIAYRNFHSNGVQAGMTAIGVGVATALKERMSTGIVAIIIGDGTLGEGLLYESMNLASIWEVPVLFVVEHNGIAQTTYTRHTIGGDIVARGRAFGLSAWRLDDQDPEFITKAAEIVDLMRQNGGPGMLVIDTGRLGPHSKGDDLRPEDEREALLARDPLKKLAENIAPSDLAAIEIANKAFLCDLESRALVSPLATFDFVPQHSLRAALDLHFVSTAASSVSVRQALNDALGQLLEFDKSVVLLGEDLHDPYGGAFKVTAGLSERFPGRVISTPISEAGITGAGIGLAMAGKKPVVEIMFADFLSLCMDQVYNHAVKFPGMFPDTSVPLVIRAPCGGRRGYGPTHSQSPENIFVSVPGLTVVYGSHRHNPGQLLINAVERWPNPTLFLEHKLLYSEKVDPQGYRPIAVGPEDLGANLFPTVHRGSPEPDITLLSYGGMLPVVERAADTLEQEEELLVEIVAPALLAPLPRQSLLRLLQDRSRILVVEESHPQFGFSAEILAMLAENGFAGRVARLGTPPVPIASARNLESNQLPDENAIITAVLGML